MNLPNNRKRDILRLLSFEFLGFGDDDDDDVPKLPEERSKLELFGKVLIALVLINESLIRLEKRKRFSLV